MSLLLLFQTGGGAGSTSVAVVGIPSAETFGVPSTQLLTYMVGVGAAEAWGLPVWNPSIKGPASAETFGLPSPTSSASFLVVGFDTASVVGVPAWTPGAVNVGILGIVSAEVVGDLTALVTALPDTTGPTQATGNRQGSVAAGATPRTIVRAR